MRTLKYSKGWGLPVLAEQTFPAGTERWEMESWIVSTWNEFKAGTIIELLDGKYVGCRTRM